MDFGRVVPMTALPEKLARDEGTGRDLFCLRVANAEELVPLAGSIGHFVCLLVWDAATESVEQVSRVAEHLLESGCVYGYRKIHHDMLSLGEPCAANTVAKLMHSEGLRAQVGYKRRPVKYGTKPAIVAANQLQRDFNVDAPNTVWVTDITYIRTHEGWLYLAAVIDL